MTPLMGSDTLTWFAWGAPRLLFVLGLGFLGANIKVGLDLIRYRRHRRSALLTWRGPRPAYYRFNILLAVTLGLLLAAKLVRQEPDRAFGEAMMFVYYGCAFPLSTRIARGFYGDGIWSDSGFMRWAQISAVAWKEEGRVTLILISRLRQIARRLEVPPQLYGQARRVLRDKIKDHDLHINSAGLDLGSRDEEDSV
jgi:hypothetical protein